MSDQSSSFIAVGRKRRPRSRALVSESESSDESPIISRKRRNPVIQESSDSENEEEIKRRRRSSSDVKRRNPVIQESSDSENEEEIKRRRRSSSDVKKKMFAESEDDSEVTDDGSMCPICLGKINRMTLKGRPGSCAHTFCFDCIVTWSKKNSTCVLCRTPFVKLEAFFSDDGILEELPVKPTTQDSGEDLGSPWTSDDSETSEVWDTSESAESRETWDSWDISDASESSENMSDDSWDDLYVPSQDGASSPSVVSPPTARSRAHPGSILQTRARREARVASRRPGGSVRTRSSHRN